MGFTEVFESEGKFNQEVRALFKSKEYQPPILISYDRQTILKMPPVPNEVFLTACIKNQKEKFTIDFDAVAKICGLSKGGAQNKFRAFMNADEKETAPNTPKSTKRKAPRPADDGVTADGSSKPARKKTRTADKGKDKNTNTNTAHTDASNNVTGDAIDMKTYGSTTAGSHNATPTINVVPAEEDAAGATAGVTPNKINNSIAKKGVAKRVKREIATQGETSAAEGELLQDTRDDSNSKLNPSLDKSCAAIGVLREASSHL